MTKHIDSRGLEYYTKKIKEYINLKVELTTNKSTHCPNCGALITSSKCEYCGTDFEASMMWGMSI